MRQAIRYPRVMVKVGSLDFADEQKLTLKPWLELLWKETRWVQVQSGRNGKSLASRTSPGNGTSMLHQEANKAIGGEITVEGAYLDRWFWCSA